MNTNADYVAAMDTQLKKWDADVDALAAKGDEANAEARTAYQAQIAGLRSNRDAATKAFQEIRVASEAAGAQMHAGMELAWKTMQTALETVSASFKKS